MGIGDASTQTKFPLWETFCIVMGSPRKSGIELDIGVINIGMLMDSVEAGPNILIRNSPEMGTPKNSRSMPENSINVPNNGFILLFSPFLYNICFITIYKLNKVFLINRCFIIVLMSLVYNYYRLSGTIVI